MPDWGAEFHARDEARARVQAAALKRRCAAAKESAGRSVVAARNAQDRARHVARSADEFAGEDDIPIELDLELARVDQARRRAEGLVRRCAALAGRLDVRGAEHAARLCAREAEVARAGAARVRALVKQLERDAA